MREDKRIFDPSDASLAVSWAVIGSEVIPRVNRSMATYGARGVEQFTAHSSRQ